MSYNKTGRLIAFAASMAAVVLISGCRNPFLPSADISISNISAAESALLNSAELPVYNSTPNYYSYRVRVDFLLLNKVGVNITSVNIFYTDQYGVPVSDYKKSGGKNLKLRQHMTPPANNDPNGRTESIELLVLDPQIYTAILEPTLTPKYILATMTFRGEDENGYDIKLTAQITIKGYGF